MKAKYLPNGKIIYDGITYPGITARDSNVTFNPKSWFSHWERRITEIKSMKLDYSQIANIHHDFVHDILLYTGTKQMLNQHQKVNQLSTKLKIAFDCSYSNYRESRKGFWAFVSGLLVNKLIDKMEFPRMPLAKK